VRLFVSMQTWLDDERRFVEAYTALASPRRRQTWLRGLLRIGLVASRLGPLRSLDVVQVAPKRPGRKRAPVMIPVHLDERIDAEAAIITAYRGMEVSRGKHWLRALLLEGFQLEQEQSRAAVMAKLERVAAVVTAPVGANDAAPPTPATPESEQEQDKGKGSAKDLRGLAGGFLS
jgi:hypothetical protein